ncbi:MAG: CRISPR-associated endonuclease Cas1 [Bacteroidetes bacterium]|nr:CRISPR-associated endonuclease Cas1 [Bacteroidota bacterium]
MRISGILVTAPITIHSNALALACRHDIPIYQLDRLGEVTGIFRKATFNNATLLRRNQVLFAHVGQRAASDWVVDLVLSKVGSQGQNLRYFQDRKAGLTGDVSIATGLYEKTVESLNALRDRDLSDCRPILLGLEGASARMYWDVLSSVLPEGYRFENRSRHPPLDPFNAALNYLYGILYTLVETAVYTAGLDPFLGIFHTDQYQKPTLAFDLIEPFRPWADRFLVERFWADEIREGYFVRKGTAVYLSKAGKQYLIPLFLEHLNDKTTFNGQVAPRKTLIQRRAGELALMLLAYQP